MLLLAAIFHIREFGRGKDTRCTLAASECIDLLLCFIHATRSCTHLLALLPHPAQMGTNYGRTRRTPTTTDVHSGICTRCLQERPQLAHRSVMPLKMVLATSERRTKASSAECSDSSSRASCGTSCTPNFAHADGATVCPSRPMTSEAQAAPALSAEQIAGAAVLDLSSMFLMRPYRDVGRLEVGPVRLHGAAGYLLADLSLPLRHLRQDRGLGSAGSAVPRQLRWGCLPYLCCSECAVCIVCEA